MTGGNSGIGTETVKALLAAGATVVFGSRGVAAGEETIAKELLGPTPARSGAYALPTAAAGRDSCLQLDLERLESVRAFAEAAAAGGAIDLLVCNAGIMALPTREVTPHGWEKQIGTNHFGHHFLISLLRDKMVAQGTPARIVLVSSLAHKRGSVEVGDLHFVKGRPRKRRAGQSVPQRDRGCGARRGAKQLNNAGMAMLGRHVQCSGSELVPLRQSRAVRQQYAHSARVAFFTRENQRRRADAVLRVDLAARCIVSFQQHFNNARVAPFARVVKRRHARVIDAAQRRAGRQQLAHEPLVSSPSRANQVCRAGRHVGPRDRAVNPQ